MLVESSLGKYPGEAFKCYRKGSRVPLHINYPGRLTVPSPCWCSVGMYVCLLINIKVASNHVPTLIFSHVTSFSYVLEISKKQRWPRESGTPGPWMKPQQQGQRAAGVTSNSPPALAGMRSCGIHPHDFNGARKPPKSLAVRGHYAPEQNALPIPSLGTCSALHLCVSSHTSPEILVLPVSFLLLLSPNAK